MADAADVVDGASMAKESQAIIFHHIHNFSLPQKQE